MKNQERHVFSKFKLSGLKILLTMLMAVFLLAVGVTGPQSGVGFAANSSTEQLAGLSLRMIAGVPALDGCTLF